MRRHWRAPQPEAKLKVLVANTLFPRDPSVMLTAEDAPFALIEMESRIRPVREGYTRQKCRRRRQRASGPPVGSDLAHRQLDQAEPRDRDAWE